MLQQLECTCPLATGLSKDSPWTLPRLLSGLHHHAAAVQGSPGVPLTAAGRVSRPGIGSSAQSQEPADLAGNPQGKPVQGQRQRQAAGHHRPPLPPRSGQQALAADSMGWFVPLPQIETQTQTASAEGMKQPFVEGDTLAEKRTIKCGRRHALLACPATAPLACCQAAWWYIEHPECRCSGTQSVRLLSTCLPPCRESYEDVLKERSGTAEDVSVVDEAQTSLGRCAGQRLAHDDTGAWCRQLHMRTWKAPPAAGCTMIQQPAAPATTCTDGQAPCCRTTAPWPALVLPPQDDQGPPGSGAAVLAGGQAGRGQPRRLRAVRPVLQMVGHLVLASFACDHCLPAQHSAHPACRFTEDEGIADAVFDQTRSDKGCAPCSRLAWSLDSV